MGRPNKYPDQFRQDALELVQLWASDRGGCPIAGDYRGHVVELGQWPECNAARGADPDALRSPTRRVASASQGEDRAADGQGDLAAGGGIFRPGDDAVIRLRFVPDNQADLPVKRMCELVELPRSSFFAWRNRTPSAARRRRRRAARGDP